MAHFLKNQLSTERLNLHEFDFIFKLRKNIAKIRPRKKLKYFKRPQHQQRLKLFQIQSDCYRDCNFLLCETKWSSLPRN